jgi:hypothetical protein
VLSLSLSLSLSLTLTLTLTLNLTLTPTPTPTPTPTLTRPTCCSGCPPRPRAHLQRTSPSARSTSASSEPEPRSHPAVMYNYKMSTAFLSVKYYHVVFFLLSSISCEVQLQDFRAKTVLFMNELNFRSIAAVMGLPAHMTGTHPFRYPTFQPSHQVPTDVPCNVASRLTVDVFIINYKELYITLFNTEHWLCVLTRRRGADTAHTQMGRPTYEAPTREYTHQHTQTQTNTQRGPTKAQSDAM